MGQLFSCLDYLESPDLIDLHDPYKVDYRFNWLNLCIDKTSDLMLLVSSQGLVHTRGNVHVDFADSFGMLPVAVLFKLSVVKTILNGKVVCHYKLRRDYFELNRCILRQACYFHNGQFLLIELNSKHFFWVKLSCLCVV